MDAIDTLLDDNWKEYPDQFKPHARAFFKRFDTPTECACNTGKGGIQVCIYVYKHNFNGNTEMNWELEVAGELKDSTWVKLHQWALDHKDIKETLAIIPRLLATWEFIANFNEGH